jgi:zinc ribbon protein
VDAPRLRSASFPSHPHYNTSMGSEFIPTKPGAGESAQKDARPGASSTSPTPLQAAAAAKPTDASSSVATQTTAKASTKIPWPASPTTEPKPAATYRCPKCGTDARDVARFCARCHTTLRFECPSCGNRQRAAGKCEKCGIDFIKYIGAVVAAKQAEADVVHERLENRTNFLKAFLLLPFNGGISLIRYFFLKSDRS